jgi:hypothetical protein
MARRRGEERLWGPPLTCGPAATSSKTTIKTVRHGYPWVPTDQAHDRPRQVGPAY